MKIAFNSQGFWGYKVGDCWVTFYNNKTVVLESFSKFIAWTVVQAHIYVAPKKQSFEHACQLNLN